MTNKANTTIQDLYSFKNMQIEALQNELFKAKKKITNLETFIFEL